MSLSRLLIRVGARFRDAVRPVDRGTTESRRRLLASVIEQSPNAILVTDIGGRAVYVNPAFSRITGYDEERARGHSPLEKDLAAVPAKGYGSLSEALASAAEWRGEIQSRRPDGTSFWSTVTISPVVDEERRARYFVWSGEDITERKEVEANRLRESYRDPLTGLPNRALALDRLQQAVAAAQRSRGVVCVMALDVAHFREINQSLGREVGDLVLQELSQRLQTRIRASDTLARFEGEHFVAVVSGFESLAVGRLVAVQLLGCFTDPFEVGGGRIHLSANVGISGYPDDGENPQALLLNAEAAMHRAKAEGGNTFRFFTPAIQLQTAERLQLEARLHQALLEDGLAIDFQPIISLRDRRVTAFEALARWRPVDGEEILPEQFIPIAEEKGLIDTLGRWVLRRACQEAVRWKGEGSPRVAINLSVRQIGRGRVVAAVDEALEASGLAAGALELEVTESALLSEDDGRLDELRELRRRGVRISVDDFGTGFSSLSYLRRFEFDTLKIDRSFASRLAEEVRDQDLVRAILAMGRSLGMEVVAEGVETEAQLSFFREHGCDLVQGFLLGRPLRSEQVETWLRGFSLS